MKISLGLIYENILLEDKCKQILKEELSVSKDVIKATYELVKEINQQLHHGKWQKKDGIRRIGFFFTPKFSNKLFDLDSVNGFIYDVGDYENYIKTFENIVSALYYKNNNILYVNIPYFNGKIYFDSLIPLLAHELEHKYQDALSGDISYKGLSIDGKIIMDNFEEWSNEYCLGYALYFLSKQEIDAMCHQLAMELKKKKVDNMDKYARTYTIASKNKIKEFINKFKSNPEIIHNCSKYLNCNTNNVIKYLNSQMGYLERKFRKVAMLHFKTGFGEDNTDAIKPYSMVKKINKENIIETPPVNADE